MRQRQYHVIPTMKPLLTLLGAAILCAAVLPVASCGQTQYVQPVDWTKYDGKTGVQPGDGFGQSLATLIRNEERYELGWLATQPIGNDVQGWEGSSCYYPQFSPSYSIIEAVRPLASIAYGTAVQIKTGIYSPSVTGFSAAEAIQRAEQAIRGVAYSHYANHANPTPSNDWWGGTGPISQNNPRWHSSQTYGPQAAEAAWLLWDHLGSDTRLAVAKMMEHEADYIAGQNPLYWADRSGNILTPGDTQAEEDAWSGHELVVAQAMMPNHPHAALWRQKASQWMVASYSRQSDLTNNALVDGKPVADYLDGYNTFADGVAVNHSFVHPDYMATDQYRYSGLIETALAGQYAVESMFFNADVVYSALAELEFTPGPDAKYDTGKTMVQPGGTIFQRTPGGDYVAEFYYPMGTDWTYRVGTGHLNMDLLAEYLGLDSGKDYDAMGWAQARLDSLLALQDRPEHDGNIYEPGDWITQIRDPEEDFFCSGAQAWLQWWMMRNDLFSPVSDHWAALPTPEPSAWALAATGVMGVLGYTWRKRR